MSQKPKTSLRCLFCGEGLKEAKRGAFSCPGCGAIFRAQIDEGGCIVGLKVQECGTPDCCRHKAEASGEASASRSHKKQIPSS